MTPEETKEQPSNVVSYREFLEARRRRDRRAHAPPDGQAAETDRPGEERSDAGADGTAPAGGPAEDLRRSIGSIPEPRPEKIREVQERIREGFYDRPEVLEELADRLAAFLAPEERPRNPERSE